MKLCRARIDQTRTLISSMTSSVPAIARQAAGHGAIRRYVDPAELVIIRPGGVGTVAAASR
jgi:hypothetical protein